MKVRKQHCNMLCPHRKGERLKSQKILHCSTPGRRYKEKERDMFIGEKKNMFRPSRKADFWKLETGKAAVTDDAEALQGYRQLRKVTNIPLMFQNSQAVFCTSVQ